MRKNLNRIWNFNIFIVVISLKGSSGLGVVQTNSLMHHNQIVNSSIIINIIINGKNESHDMLDETMNGWQSIVTEEDSTTSLPREDDPGFWMPVAHQPYQKPDLGFLKLNDRRERPYISETTPDSETSTSK